MLKRLVTVAEFVKVSTFITPDQVNLELDIDNALSNYNSLSAIDKQTIRLQQYLDQAGNQVNSLSNNQIYNMWDFMLNAIENPDPIINTSDTIKTYEQNINTIKYVIIKWVETFIQTNQLFADATTPAPSNLDIMLEGKSENANIETTRLDLINTLNTTFFFRKVDSFGDVDDEYKNKFNWLYEDVDIATQTWSGNRFKNGYLLKDVDYLGQENKARLDTLEPKVTNIETINKQLQNNITQLQDLTNTHTRQIQTNTQKIQTNTNYIDGFYKQYTQYTTQNDSNISAMQTKIDSLTTGLEFQGDWNANTTYSKDNTVQHNGTIWISNIDNNLGIEPTEANSQYWTNLGSAFQSAIDSSIAKLRQELQSQITLNTSNLISAQNDIGVIQNDIEDLKNDDKTLNQKITRNSDAITILQADFDTYKTSNDSAISTINNALNNVVNLSDNQTISGVKTFNNNVILQNRNRIQLRSDTTTNALEVFVGRNDTNGYVEAKTGDLILSGNTINVNAKRITNLATPTSNSDAANKSYVDDKVASISLGGTYLRTDITTNQNVQGPVNFSNATVNNYRVLTTNDNVASQSWVTSQLDSYVTTNTSQTISAGKAFNADVVILNRNRIRLRTDNTTNNLEIYTGSNDDNGYVESKTGYLVLSGTAISANNKRIFNLATPTSNNDATTKEYVDGKLIKRKSFKLNQFTKFYDGGFDRHSNWWGGVWRIPSSTLALPSGTRIISVTFDMSVDYNQAWYRQSMFNWWWDTAGYLVVRIIKIYDSNSDFTYWSDNVTVNVEYGS